MTEDGWWDRWHGTREWRSGEAMLSVSYLLWRLGFDRKVGALSLRLQLGLGGRVGWRKGWPDGGNEAWKARKTAIEREIKSPIICLKWKSKRPPATDDIRDDKYKMKYRKPLKNMLILSSAADSASLSPSVWGYDLIIQSSEFAVICKLQVTGCWRNWVMFSVLGQSRCFWLSTFHQNGFWNAATRIRLMGVAFNLSNKGLECLEFSRRRGSWLVVISGA